VGSLGSLTRGGLSPRFGTTAKLRATDSRPAEATSSLALPRPAVLPASPEFPAVSHFIRHMSSDEAALTVSQLTEQIKSTLSGEFSGISVRGEIGDLTRASSGHCYFSLKDDNARLAAVIWRSTAQRLKFKLEEGVEVLCRGSIDVYPPRGSYQLTVNQLVPVGVGPLQLAFEQLQKKLAAEGLFEPRHKQALPRFPRRIVLVTSPQGAAVRDFLQVLSHRWRLSEVLLIPVRVQGEGAGREIARALAAANRLEPQPDVIALVRGGGSAEDLWSFNEELVVRAIFKSRVPVVSGVGHEVDVTLADLVADVRALTPTDAAEKVVPKQAEILAWLRDVEQRLAGSLAGRWRAARQQVELLANRPVIARPLDMVLERAQQLDELQLRLQGPMERRLERARFHCEQLAGKLETLSPLGVLQRGFSLTLAEGHIVTASAQLEPGQLLETRLASGKVFSRVERTERGAAVQPGDAVKSGERPV
jgi:exodeoxyribonuclease VII large subunit